MDRLKYLMESVAVFFLKTATFETRFKNITNTHIGGLGSPTSSPGLFPQKMSGESPGDEVVGSPLKPKFYVTLLSSIFSRLLKNDANLSSYNPDHSGSFHCLAFFRRVFRSGFHNIPAAGHIKLKQAERTTV